MVVLLRKTFLLKGLSMAAHFISFILEVIRPLPMDEMNIIAKIKNIF
ncbi:MAG: hypothetical protein LBB91_10920 [Clostridiales bacterium]|nr:hypothetical protein [Clostridiales bacterium]